MQLAKQITMIIFLILHVSYGNELRLGIIGLDTSHVEIFTKTFNDKEYKNHIAGAKVVGAYRGGSNDIVSSYSRLDKFTKILTEKYQVKIYSSIQELCSNVDAVLIESIDGRKHLEQVEQVFKAGKNVFIDKPLAHNLKESVAIYKLSQKYDVPYFSSSSLRFYSSVQKMRDNPPGRILNVTCHGPVTIEPHHGDLFWYGIHPVEALFTVLGTGCTEVSRIQSESTEIVVGKWDNDRIGTLIGNKIGKEKYTYKMSIYGTDGYTIEDFSGDYTNLLVEVLKFLKSGKPPIKPEETLEIMAYMEAADESKRLGGAPVKISEIMIKSGFIYTINTEKEK